MTTSGNHLWISGLEYLTGCATTATQANWLLLYTGVAPYFTYAGFWKLILLTACPALGTANVFDTSTGNTELTTVGGYTVLGARIDQTVVNSVLLTGGTANSIDYLCTSNNYTLGSGVIGWSSATFTCNYAEIIAATASAGTSPVLGQYDFTGAYTVTAGTFSVAFGTDNTNAHTCFNLVMQ